VASGRNCWLGSTGACSVPLRIVGDEIQLPVLLSSVHVERVLALNPSDDATGSTRTCCNMSTRWPIDPGPGANTSAILPAKQLSRITRPGHHRTAITCRRVCCANAPAPP
jgi:hypothetical protein